MAILTGPEILRQIAAGRIVIDPFDAAAVNPNSVDLRLGDRLLVYDPARLPFRVERSHGWHDASSSCYLDAAAENPTRELAIPPCGLVLQPGTLYLASTLEYTETHGFVPYIDGKSSLGRLGVSVHVTAGRGDVGFCGRWTLELTCVHPVRIYAGRRIAQITYHTVEGEVAEYRGRYQGDRGPAASRLWMGDVTVPPVVPPGGSPGEAPGPCASPHCAGHGCRPCQEVQS